SVAATVGADLLTEPLLHNPQLRVQVAESRSVRQRLVLVEVTRVGDLLDYDRRDWLDPLTLVRRMGLSSPRPPRRVLQEVKATLTPHCSGLCQPSLARGRTPPILYPRPAGPFHWAPTLPIPTNPSPFHCKLAA
ncbi:unnamed protein product, partial [Natator depressus]